MYISLLYHKSLDGLVELLVRYARTGNFCLARRGNLPLLQSFVVFALRREKALRDKGVLADRFDENIADKLLFIAQFLVEQFRLFRFHLEFEPAEIGFCEALTLTAGGAEHRIRENHFVREFVGNEHAAVIFHAAADRGYFNRKLRLRKRRQ